MKAMECYLQAFAAILSWGGANRMESEDENP
jgi:hypothetical protein